MAQEGIWFWDNTNKRWVKAQCDADGKLLISDADPFTIAQATPENLKHVPHGYYAAGPSYLPLAVDSAGKLQLAITSLVSSKIISSSRNMTAASGNVSYTGVGFQPACIIAFSPGLGVKFYSIVVSDSTTLQRGLVIDGTGLASYSATLVRLQENATGTMMQLGEIASYDADGFTLAWTKVGEPSANTAALYFLCLK